MDQRLINGYFVGITPPFMDVFPNKKNRYSHNKLYHNPI